MQELVGKLATLDPQASDSLKVIAYFDALIQTRSGRLALLRAAARLTGCVAGIELPGDLAPWRVSPEGATLPARPVEDPFGSRAEDRVNGWPGRRVPGGGRVWLERRGPVSPVDQMVLERFVLAVGLIVPHPSANRPTPASVVLVDAAAALEERREAATRCRLAAGEFVRAAVVGPRVGGRDHDLPVVATPWGEFGLMILRRGDRWPAGPAGIGIVGPPLDLPASWSSALVALRARRSLTEVASADDLGAVVALVQAVDAGAPLPPDVVQVEEVRQDAWLKAVLDAVTDAPSVRGAAAALGVHHSTLRARLDQLARTLGYDVTTPHGRTRLDLALALARVRQVRD